MYTPFVIEKSATGERSYDIWSRLLKDRIVFLGTGVDDFVANSLIAQMMFLDKEDRNMPIEFYIKEKYMSSELYLKRLALEIEKYEEMGNTRKAQELHNYFLKVANIRDLDPEAFADDYREEQELMPKLNEEYYGEYQENPDEDIVDDSLASDMYDHDVNEFKKDTSSNAMDLINSLRREMQHNDTAQKLLDILQDELG